MEEQKSSIGSIIGTIIIIAIIILGGLYFWGKRIEEAKLNQNITKNTNTDEPIDQSTMEANVIRSTSSSDDLTSIEVDLNNTKTTGLDVELSTTTTQ